MNVFPLGMVSPAEAPFALMEPVWVMVTVLNVTVPPVEVMVPELENEL